MMVAINNDAQPSLTIKVQISIINARLVVFFISIPFYL